MRSGVIASQSVGDPVLQELKDSCRLYFTLDATQRGIGNIIFPDFGNGNINSAVSNYTTSGKINEGALIDANNKAFVGDNAMNANNNLVTQDIFSFSLWRGISNDLEGSFELFPKSNGSSANYSSYTINGNFLDIGLISRSDSDGLTIDFLVHRYDIQGLYDSGFNHIYGGIDVASNTSKLFINGVEITSYSVLTKGLGLSLTVRGSAKVTIGNVSTNNFPLNNSIDEVAFMYGLEANQLRADKLYNNGNGKQLF